MTNSSTGGSNWFTSLLSKARSPARRPSIPADATKQASRSYDRGKRYYVAVLRAGDLRSRGLQVVPRVEGHAPGHAEIPQLTYESRKEGEAKEAEQLLARKLCLEILGPLP